jgi:hypothetical protein
MRKLSLKTQLKNAQEELKKFRAEAKQALYDLRYPGTRPLLSVEAAEPDGRINGMTVPEMLAIVNLTEATGEQVYLSASGKTITFHAKRKSNYSVSAF